MATILVVDDLAANRHTLTTLLRTQGHRVHEAANGAEGLLAVQTEHPDLVITDVLMPVMDGYELVRRLRLDPKTSGTPVVFHTANYGAREARALALSTGVSYVLTKPAEPSEVLRIVQRVLSGELATGTPTPASSPAMTSDREQLQLLTDTLSDRMGDLRAANARLRALINIGLELASERDADRLLESVCNAARDLFGATYVTLGIVDRVDRRIQRFVSCGSDATSWINTGDPVWGILGVVVAERRPLRGENPGGDPTRLQLPRGHPEVQTFVIVPIASSEQVYGWMCLVGNEGRAFTEHDEQLVLALGGHVGRIYELEHEIRERRQAELALRQNGVATVRALTEAQASMQAMRASDNLKTAILDGSLDCVVTMDHRGLITEFNAAAERTFGYKRAEALGQPLADLIVPPEYRDAHRRGLERYLRTGEASMLGKRLELSAVRRDGTRLPVEVAIIPLPVTGDPLFTGFLRDITEQKRAEEEIRDSAQLSALGAAVGLALTDTDSLASALQKCAEALVHHLGAAFARIWILSEPEGVLELQASAGLYTHLDGLHGRIPIGQFKIGRIAREQKPHLTNAVVGDPEVHDQEWAQREGMVAFAGHPLVVGNRVVGVMALFARHPLSDGVLSSLAPVADHIALGIERHRTISALRTAEERTRYALEAAGVGIWDMRFDTGVLEWSELLEKQYGLEAGTFGGTFEAFIERVHPDDQVAVLEAVTGAMKTGRDFSIHHRSLWPDGTVRWLSGFGRIKLDSHGNAARGVGISLDVTERRMLEAQHLAAQKMEALGRLAGGVAHDFNNLLTAILGYTEMLLDDLGPAHPSREDVGEIRKASLSAARLTRQLLAFSRNDTVKPTLIDVNAVVSDMRSIVERLVGDDVRVALDLEADLARVMVDLGQLEQIVVNLAVNARDAMPRGGTLRIVTENVELDAQDAKTYLSVKPGPYVSLAVSDTGTGMTPETQARVFEPFFTTKEPGQGTGLGLATVHGIVTQAGGSINVSSEIDKGTSFTVYFPRADAAELEIVAAPAVAPPPQATLTALVVDDSDGMRELARSLLQRQGFRVLVAANSDQALRLFDRNAVDILLTDVVMPGAGGAELASRLASRRPGLKVIYMSGYAEKADALSDVLGPGTAVLLKPFTSAALAAAVRAVLDQ
jgi:PAS domain S-box-containing protein